MTDKGRAAAVRSCLHHKTEARMFFFFSNKLGWLGSILVSLIVTGLLVALFKLFF